MHLFCTTLAAGQNPMWLLGDAEVRTRKAGERFANKGWDEVKGMATEEEINDQQSRGSQGTNGGEERNEGSVKDRESAKLEGTREDRKDHSTGESSGKAGGSKRGPQENREGGNDAKTSPRNSAGTTPKKTKVLDTRRKLAEIEKRTAEFKARLIELMMVGDEEDPQGTGSREERGTGQGEARHEGKYNIHKGTPSKKGKNKDDPPTEGTKNAMTPPAIDSTTPKVTGACDGLWSLRERVLGWFDPEGTPKTGEKQRESKEGEGTSAAGEGGLKRIVTTLTRALNKNQGYLADAKKKLTFDEANITEFLIDYENLAALLKWTEEEKMDHLGKHVSLSLGRDIMAIVATSGSWKETRNEMMRKYLKVDKMATEAELAAVQRKNYATYNDFLRAFTLVALRIPGVTDRIMSKYFLRQLSEFDKDKILSAYQLTSKFEYTRDVDFSTVTDLAEKTVVTETLAMLKEREVIDLTVRTGDKVKKGIKSLHEKGERINWNSPGGMRRVVNLLNNLDIAAVEAEPVADIVWDQLRGRGPQVNFILEGNGQDKVNITTRRASAEKKLIRETVMEEVSGISTQQVEAESGEQEKAYGKVREEEPVDKVTTAKKKFRYQITILAGAEVDSSLSEFLGTMVSVSFQTMLQASPRLLKGLRHLLTRKRIEVDETLEPQEQEPEEAEALQGVSNLQSVPEGLSMPDREGGEVMRAPPGTKLSFHAPPVGKLKVQIRTHHTDALVDGGAEITLIRRDFATITGCTVNKEVARSIRGAGGEIPFTGYVTKRAVRAGIRESIWSFQRMTGMEEMDHDIILGRPWCANVEMIGMHLHDGTYMVDIEDPVTGRGELLRLLGTGGDPPKGYDQLPLDARDRPYTAMHTPVRQLQMQVTPMGFTNAVAEAQRRMLAIAGDMFPEKCEPYTDDNPVKGARYKDEAEVQLGVRKYILDARDNLSGYVEAVALKRKTGKGVADWVEDFYLRHPFVRRFITDNGTEFVNQEVLSRLKALHVPIKITEPYHPEANAPVERGHGTLKNTIAKLAADDLGNWSRYLRQAVFSENVTPKRTTGCIPAELWYGREIDFSVEALVPTWNRLDDHPYLTTEELITARCQQVARNEEALEEVVNCVMDTRMRDKARWDQVKNIRKEPLQVGEKVLVRNSALESTWSGQLGRRFKGPYRIAKAGGIEHV
ncbi:hypothetical protein CBR_g41338 [Chara braunii]|uniref:Integrase catalytic domain-containing protein n=1 Tax=Chara braunii TaxID=69332 RepID=A0A388LVS0_CHABU|nr:hypothetical protein CBR_g41338 [Chara braunii]|eukprot:GBG86343.1 hypothetical protein CBR_g41338 [Chara braunii]